MNHEKDLREALDMLIQASVMMFNGGWDEDHQKEIEDNYRSALKHAQKILLESKLP